MSDFVNIEPIPDMTKPEARIYQQLGLQAEHDTP